jgi:hypothetical protein
MPTLHHHPLALLALASLSGLTTTADAQSLRGEQKLSPNALPGQAVESDEPTIVAVGSRFYALWFEQNTLTGRDLFFSRSIDGGRSFSAAVRLDQAPGLANTNEPVIVAEGNTVAVFWLDDRQTPTLESVYARISTDSGLTFGPEINLTPGLSLDLGDADNLVAAISLPNIAVGFEDDAVAKSAPLPSSNEDFYVVCSQNGGSTFGAPQRVNRPPLGAGSSDVDDPTLALSGNTVHAVWVDNRGGLADKVFANRSTNGGLSFAAVDQRVDDSLDPAADVEDPRIDAAGNQVAVLWRDARGLGLGLYQLYITSSLDGGATWLPDQRLDGAGAVSTAATSKRGWIDLNGGVAHCAWADNRFAPGLALHDIWYRTATLGSGGLSLGLEERLDTGSNAGQHDAGLPRVLAQDGYVYVNWQDRRDDPLGLSDSLYLRIKVGSAPFSAEIPLTAGLGLSGDAEENGLAIGSYRDAVSIWGDDRSEPLTKFKDIFVNGLRLPTLGEVAPPGLLQLRINNTAAQDQGRPFLVAFSISGTSYTPLPSSTSGLGVALSIDALTLAGLELLPFFSGTINAGQGLTIPLPGVGLPIIAVGLLWNPTLGFDFYAATDPLLLPPGQ